MTLEEAAANLDGTVVYNRPPQELGTISYVTDRYVFVRYGDDIGAKATRPEDLSLAFRTDWPAESAGSFEGRH